jgi:anhydro-N-acetylmuramic acid kinase
MSKRQFIGLASGSSLLGVDAALVRAEGVGTGMSLRLEHFHHAPFGNELRELLMRVTTNPTAELRHLGALHRVLAENYSLAVKQLLEQSRTPVQQVLCVGCPGQALWHDPDGRYPATLSLGMASVLAERTGLTTVSDFAGRDLAVGGQGAPLSAAVDALLFHQPKENRVVLHLGSVASVVALPTQLGTNGRNIVGFEAAPCTMLLDGLMRMLTSGREPFDAGGKHAVQGRCLEPLLERWLQNHYFAKRPPKCVPRLEFGVDFLDRAIEQAKRVEGNLHDVLCTMTHFAARSIVHALKTWLPFQATRILLSGRGVRNGFLWHLLEQQLSPLPLEKIDVHGIPAEARQAVAHAGLAALSLDGVPINLPAVTGASGQRLLGQFTPGQRDNWARCLAWMARQSAPLQSAAA